jgi:HAD superfamily hydrolase (TIGR01549 family)
MIKALIFDCWGTIFTNTQTPHPFGVFAEKLGYDISDRMFLKAFERHMMTDGDSVSKHISSLLLELGIDAKPGLEDELEDIILGSVNTQASYDDTVEVLDRLRKNYRLILLSNTFREGFENLRSVYPIDDWFELVSLSYVEHHIKPNPMLFEKVLSQSGLDKSEVIVVGDNYDDDVLAAEQAGIDAILIDRRNRYPDVTEHKAHNLRELLTLLEID